MSLYGAEEDFENINVYSVSNSDYAVVNKKYVDDNIISSFNFKESVLDISNTPVTSNTGDRYIVGSTPTGAFSGQANNLAQYDGSAWVFETVEEGDTSYVEDVNKLYVYNGSSWVPALEMDLTTSEIDQLKNINTETISNTQWSYLGNLNQSLTTTNSPTFAGLTIPFITNAGNITLNTTAGGDIFFQRSGTTIGQIQGNGINIESGGLLINDVAVIDSSSNIFANGVNVGNAGTSIGSTAIVIGDAAESAKYKLSTGGFNFNIAKNNGSGTYNNVCVIDDNGVESNSFIVNGSTVIDSSRNVGCNLLTVSTDKLIVNSDGQTVVRDDSFPPLEAIRETSVTNGNRGSLQLTHKSSGDITDGFGSGMEMWFSDTGGGFRAATIYAVRNGGDTNAKLELDATSGIDIVNGNLQMGGVNIVNGNRYATLTGANIDSITIDGDEISSSTGNISIRDNLFLDPGERIQWGTPNLVSIQEFGKDMLFFTGDTDSSKFRFYVNGVKGLEIGVDNSIINGTTLFNNSIDVTSNLTVNGNTFINGAITIQRIIQWNDPPELVGGTQLEIDSSNTVGIAASSRRFKNNIEYFDNARNCFKFKPCRYTFKNTTIKDIGLIAEDVDEYFPEFVTRGKNGMVRALKYDKIVSVLINDLKDLYSKVDTIDIENNNETLVKSLIDSNDYLSDTIVTQDEKITTLQSQIQKQEEENTNLRRIISKLNSDVESIKKRIGLE